MSAHFIVLGGPEHLKFFQDADSQRSPAYQWFWTVPRDAKPDDIALVYLTTPISQIVGSLLIIGEPFFNIAEFENPHTQKKWMAEVSFGDFFGVRPDLSFSNLRALFPDWRWLAYPRSAARIPAEILKPILELTMKTKDKPHRETRKPKKRQGKPYLLNTRTSEVHHVPRVTAACKIARIESFKEFDTLEEARAASTEVYNKALR